MGIKLYYTPRTRAVRVRWLLEELGLPYELINIDLFNDGGNTYEYKQIHPLGCVPVLEVDGEVMFESGAICDWLTDLYADKNLAPSIDSKLRMKYKQWFYFVLATMEPLAWNIVLHKSLLPKDQRIVEVVVTSEKNYVEALSVIEKELKGKEFMLGKQFSTLDILLTTLLTWMPKQIKPFKYTYEYMKRMRTRKAYKSVIY